MTAIRTKEPYLHSLDLLRGFAALSVCLYHTGFMLKPGFHLLPGGYLCVDMFFLLSGFVIARTYDPRIAAGMKVGVFCAQRLARLYPLFWATTLAGFAVVMAKLYQDHHVLDSKPALLTLFGNLLLIPNFLKPYGLDSLFPFNGATWSIFFEFYVNVLFFFCWPLLSTRRLCSVVGLAGILLIAAASQKHSLDIGDKTADLIVAIPRVLFSFFLGVLICRSGLKGRRRYGVWPSLVGLGIVLLAICMRDTVPTSMVWLLDICIVVFVFPVTLIAFTKMQFPGYHARVSAFLGNISYAVYLLQTPLMILYAGLPQIFLREKIAALTPWAGMVFLPAIVAIAFLVWKYFEVPAKHAVRQWHAALVETSRGAA
ncbi:MAG: acyltransferase [Alphaproteobacteria bacterium]|nr:acyltransferase [Alphaproteobacteria bacterium]